MASYLEMDPTYMMGDHSGSLHDTPALGVPILPPHSGNQAGIPLICHCCEKKKKSQRFSDLSHLLTHVSSKAHLLELYNLRILSQSDQDSAERCQKFDEWNKKWGIDRLVLQRMEARGEKGLQSQQRNRTPRGAASGRPATRRSGRARGRGANTGSRGRARNIQETPDVKYESDEATSFAGGFGSLDGTPMQPMQQWTNDFDTMMSGGAQDGSMSQMGFADLEGDDNGSSRYEPSEGGSSYPSENVTESTEVNEIDGNTPTLKGVVLPGMGLFDAAEEEQRRKRNQRKHPAVLRRLAINSTLVNTQEDVYDSNFCYQRSRDVYDDPSAGETEGDEDDDDQDKRRKRRNTQARGTATRSARNSTSSHESRLIRATRATAQAAAQQLGFVGGANSPTHTRALDSGGRMAGSAMGHSSMSHEQLPLHNHGFQGGMDMYHDPMGVHSGIGWAYPQAFAGAYPADFDAQEQVLDPMLREDADGSEFLPMPQAPTSVSYGLTMYDSQDRLPGLALRPGNPNLSFASSAGSLERSSASRFPGKENDSLPGKPVNASSNPYLQPTSTHGESYNPLYVQPQEGTGFRMYTSYDDEVKPGRSGFQPINGHGGFNALQVPSSHNNDYSSNQDNGTTDFDI
ncbi:uncharacterized protein F4822DRAFT_446086 [Hypoxylon trugodes]|uniref:uncharacterized protein n=1 Tax=Hypoxylon trugodes TaxID=326681 RepID=UPI00218F9C83|nr:uncharacterized protein F4822DRAFT_446086 [Hypoxylon trugodes]KAI1384943.1 hypothetical protein F4822DRAFT_446086 [Hypoxylon trugodes]